MKLKITKDFPFAHNGYDVRQYTAGSEVETDDAEFVAVSTREGWAEAIDQADDKAEKKAKKAAPENKAKGSE